MENTFLYYKNQVEDLSYEILAKTTDEMFKERIQAAFRRLEREQMNLLIIGEFSRGKSTFINSILEEPILPTGVNPTTATINILKGGDTREMHIRYWSGEEAREALPDTKVNKHLKTLVTTKNEEVNKIQKITIHMPGKLQEWQCVLVDTPGVNDLDETREEVTYRYLSEADGCIVLLDGQQPFSSSERSFIQNKVLAKDINRLMFVVNRIDEIDKSPDGEAVVRIKEHIKKLIGEYVPAIQEPQVFAVSSKKAAKARVSGESDVWSEGFAQFEKALVAFIGKHASEGKLLGHVEQMIHILEDQMRFSMQQKEALQGSKESIEQMIQGIQREQQQLGIKLQGVQKLLVDKQYTFAEDLRRLYGQAFEKLKSEILASLEHTESEEEINALKAKIAQGVRYIVETLAAYIEEGRTRLMNEINQQFESGEDMELPAIIRPWARPKLEMEAITLALPMPVGVSMTPVSVQDEQAMIVLGGGGLVTCLAGALFGPIGVVAGIAGVLCFGDQVGDYLYANKRREEEARRKRTIMQQMSTQLDQMLKVGRDNIEDIAKQEIVRLESATKEVVDHKRKQMQVFIQTKRDEVSKEERELEKIEANYEKEIQVYRSFLEKMTQLKGAIQHV